MPDILKKPFPPHFDRIFFEQFLKVGSSCCFKYQSLTLTRHIYNTAKNRTIGLRSRAFKIEIYLHFYRHSKLHFISLYMKQAALTPLNSSLALVNWKKGSVFH